MGGFVYNKNMVILVNNVQRDVLRLCPQRLQLQHRAAYQVPSLHHL
uniref:Uncharacterized protein n=1 Tax=Arundo donax TaxID=35708 RepID=A0A0A9DPK0_ARUDO